MSAHIQNLSGCQVKQEKFWRSLISTNKFNIANRSNNGTCFAQSITKHLESKNMQDTQQFEFKKGNSEQQQLLLFINFIITNTDDGQVNAEYLYYQRAFDVVQHTHIIKKLRNKFRINGDILYSIAEFLEKREQVVQIGSNKSSTGNVTSSIVQGSTIGQIFLL